jgi:1,4-alpha-glucan branching enzyme
MVKKRFFKTKSECEVSFELADEGAKRVDLICDANGWQAVAMKRTRGGTFRTRLRLPTQQRYQFRYLVDRARWVNDEQADGYLPNDFGGENGVLSTDTSAEAAAMPLRG